MVDAMLFLASLASCGRSSNSRVHSKPNRFSHYNVCVCVFPPLSTTPVTEFSVTHYLELCCAITFLLLFFGVFRFVPPKVKRVVWTLHNIIFFYLVTTYIINIEIIPVRDDLKLLNDGGEIPKS